MRMSKKMRLLFMVWQRKINALVNGVSSGYHRKIIIIETIVVDLDSIRHHPIDSWCFVVSYVYEQIRQEQAIITAQSKFCDIAPPASRACGNRV